MVDRYKQESLQLRCELASTEKDRRLIKVAACHVKECPQVKQKMWEF